MKFYSFCLIMTLLISCKQSPDTITKEAIDVSELNNTESVQSNKDAIMSVFKSQENAWNQGDIPKFMEGYWQSEELTFIGSSGLKKGWQTTLDNYLKNYPDRATMGILSFELLKLELIGEDAAYMIGRYTLKREKDEPTGLFTLLWRKINNEWVIVSDQTCG